MDALVFNSSVAQPELSQTWPSTTPQSRNTLLDIVAGWHAWQYVVTFLLSVIVYDQGE
jgi:C-22 sterol desaturase